MKSIDRPTFVSSGILLIVFGLVMFHAPLSVYFSQFLPDSLVKAWKEILLLLITPLIIYLLYRAGYIKKLSQDLLFQLIGLYVLVHILFLVIFDTSNYQKLAGLAIDLRYLLFFVLVFSVVVLRPSIRKLFIKVGVICSGISLGFATLQATILPDNILKYIGYSKDTISPYLTVDKNTDFIRINGTLRGPNPLGAFSVIFLSLLTSFVLKKQKTAIKYKWQIYGLALLAIVALWASYSRSAFVGFVIALGLLITMLVFRKVHIRYWLMSGVILLVLVASVFSLRGSSLVQNVILHNNPNGGSSVDSNEGHVVSLQQGVEQTVRQPLGAGIGSTGSASLKSSNPIIIENQYLFIAHETGWLGLGLFIVIFELILWRLYQNKRDWLSIGVFVSGIGLAFVGLLLPVWVDDTVSLVWFGLAAVALASHYNIGDKSGK